GVGAATAIDACPREPVTIDAITHFAMRAFTASSPMCVRAPNPAHHRGICAVRDDPIKNAVVFVLAQLELSQDAGDAGPEAGNALDHRRVSFAELARLPR